MTSRGLSKARIGLAQNCAKVNSKSPYLFDVNVAASEETRSKGLGGRTAILESGEGMLFAFSAARPVSFWMKDTLIPMQIAYFDAKGRLFETHEMRVERDPSNPLKTFPSSKPTAAALEAAPSRIASRDIGKLVLCVEQTGKTAK
ncbi:MAG: DUF192 domain-containing protein [Deltaproteobacteria bacterium]|nr:DUF192 domain-containing protein [Deltaproteobacteria bacterium]